MRKIAMVIGILSVLATSANASVLEGILFDWSSPYLESNDFTLSSPSSEYEKYDAPKYLDQDVVTADDWHKSYLQFAIEYEQRKNSTWTYEEYIK